jgi:hypothetical protein
MFNPFNKPLKDLTYQDLDKLIQSNFCESLFIEFKSQIPRPEKVAKAIAGFANSYGGFLIIGANKDCGKDELPSSFPGATNMPDQPKEFIRNVCRDHVSPMPLYESKYLAVGTDRGILVVHVPESTDVPHINKDGRIYRRQSSGTDGESIAEDSRTAIDYLYAKGRAGELTWNQYILGKQDPKKVDQLVLDEKLFSVETIVCPIPINDLIPDLFADRETYTRHLPAARYDFNVDVDCVYLVGSEYYEEIDTKGCVSMQHIETSMYPNELRDYGIPARYASIPIVLPEWIMVHLRRPLITMVDVLRELTNKGIDYLGKIRIAVYLRKVKGKALFYRHYETFYDDYDIKVCRHQTLSVPVFDVYVGDVSNNRDDIIAQIMRQVARGFNLPFQG